MQQADQKYPVNGSWLRSPDDNRLRAGWRIAAFLVIFYTIALPLIFGLRELVGFSKSSPLVIVLIAVAAIPSVYIARRWIDKKDFVSLGLQFSNRAVVDLLFGFILSGIMAGAIFTAMLTLGYIDNVQKGMSGWAAASVLAEALLVMALVGYWEELVFRGYLFQNMVEGMGVKTAVLISCVIYGLVHSTNPNAGLLSSAIIVLFGFLRIYGYLSTGQLWLSIGMHTGWNYFQANIFGFSASGRAEKMTLLTHDTVAANWLTGGKFGPEGSVLTIPAILAVLLVMRAWSRSARFRKSKP